MNLKRFSIGYETCKNFELPPDTSRIPEIRRIVFHLHLFVVDFSMVNVGFLIDCCIAVSLKRLVERPLVIRTSSGRVPSTDWPTREPPL